MTAIDSYNFTQPSATLDMKCKVNIISTHHELSNCFDEKDTVLFCVHIHWQLSVWIVPFHQPHEHFCHQRKVWTPKILHGYEPGISQGPHHFSKICEQEVANRLFFQHTGSKYLMAR